MATNPKMAIPVKQQILDMAVFQNVSTIQLPYLSVGADFTHAVAISCSQKTSAVLLGTQRKHYDVPRNMTPLTCDGV